MNETQLQIIISVLNDATAGLASVGDSLNALADQAAGAGAAISTDLQSSLTAAEEAAAAAADSSAASWGEFEDSVTEAISNVTTAAQGDFEGMSSAALAAADAASSAWQTSIGELNADLADLPAAAATAGAEAGTELAGGLESSISSLGGKLMAGGAILGLLGAGITAGVGSAVSAAAQQQETVSNSTAELTGLVQANSNGLSMNGAQIADLTAKLQTYQSEIATAQAGLLAWNGTTAEVTAAHEKDNAEIATATAAMLPYQQQLAALINTESLGGQSATALLQSYEDLANNGTNLLYASFNDSLGALVTFTNELGAGKTTTLAYNDALALVASGNASSMTEAVQEVTMAFQGQGRSLEQIVPALKDGAGGATALNDIWSLLGPTIQKNAGDLGPQMAGIANNATLLGAAAANNLQPGLTGAAQGTNTLLQSLTTLATEHPSIAAAFTSIAGSIGLLATALGTLGFGAGALLMLGEAFDRIAAVGIGTAFSTALAPLKALVGGIGDLFTALIAGDPVTLAIVAAILAVAAAIALVVTHLPEIESFINTVLNATGATTLLKQAWDAVVSTFNNELKPALEQLGNAIQPLMPLLQAMGEVIGVTLVVGVTAVVLLIASFIAGLALLLTGIIKIVTYIVGAWMTAWQDVETGIADVIKWFEQLPASVQGAITKAVSFFQPLITAFQTAVNLVNQIMNALKGPVGSVVSTISNAVGGAIQAFASGGIVNGPTLALVGEAGPEAIIPLSAFNGGSSLGGAGGIGSGAGITININGGNFLNQGGAQQIAQALATMIGRQIKLTTI